MRHCQTSTCFALHKKVGGDWALYLVGGPFLLHSVAVFMKMPCSSHTAHPRCHMRWRSPGSCRSAMAALVGLACATSWSGWPQPPMHSVAPPRSLQRHLSLVTVRRTSSCMRVKAHLFPFSRPIRIPQTAWRSTSKNRRRTSILVTSWCKELQHGVECQMEFTAKRKSHSNRGQSTTRRMFLRYHRCGTTIASGGLVQALEGMSTRGRLQKAPVGTLSQLLQCGEHPRARRHSLMSQMLQLPYQLQFPFRITFTCSRTAFVTLGQCINGR
mmetsp:Transcript_46477/g.108269  ORF Transcript_46477/g.108269 Transcript_46477/m.108269 type:complete len:270 (+) Transcript_46477:647-1456(+)